VGRRGEIQFVLSRAELTAVREAVELTPNFEGRLDVRDTVRGAVRARNGHIALEREVAERFLRRLVAVDLPTALAKAKLFRALQDWDREALVGVSADDTARAA
jgi:hypothetical protein